MRGVVTALYVVITSIFGLVLGPTLVAASTDFIFQDPNAVAKSLGLVAMLVLPIGIALMWNGSEDFETARKSATS